MGNNGAATRFCNDDVGPTAYQRLTIIGGGAWGTALALTAHRAGRRVTLWAREQSVVAAVEQTRRNPFLRSIEIPDEISVTNDMEHALLDTELAILVVPSQHLRSMARAAEKHLSPDAPVLICSKGIEAGTGQLMSDIIESEMPGRPYAVLSGPTFAIEVAEGQPTAATIAAPLDGERFTPSHLAARIAVTLATKAFRPYLSDDVAGVEIGGAVKNVLAIACGIAAGRGMGANARAAIITRGLAETMRLGEALGARRETFSGLSGAGDMMLTCSDEKSRNFSYGKTLGSGKQPVISNDGPVVEGAVNARSVMQIARSTGVDMPICAAVERVLSGQSIEEAVLSLLGTDLRAEPAAYENHPRIPRSAREKVEGMATA